LNLSGENRSWLNWRSSNWGTGPLRARTPDHTGPLLRLGNEYLLFVTPSARAGIFAITGTVTAYKRNGSDFRALVSPEPGGLPGVIAADRLSEVVTGP